VKRYQMWMTAGLLLAAQAVSAAPLPMEKVNEATWQGGKAGTPVMVKTQVLLDRAFISPGSIDGTYGSNVKKALRVFQQANGLSPSGKLDQKTWQALSQDQEPVLTRYALTKADVSGPFTRAIPTDIKKQAKLKRLSYTSPVEGIAEKFHMAPNLLRRLNPGVNFKKAGTDVVVANVAGRKPRGQVAKVVVDKKTQSVKAYDRAGKLVAFYPATVGSSDFPSPSGSLKVTAVAHNPTFTYSDKLEYAKLKKGQVVKVAPGPNNPVGAVWIDLNKRGYGIHGAPEPSKISKAQSHGCVRLTNWDALELARMVKAGVPVSFAGGPASAVAGKRQERRN
jgi:lipoprotein-anchoring transpeptidase ErfK/SrfK